MIESHQKAQESSNTSSRGFCSNYFIGKRIFAHADFPNLIDKIFLLAYVFNKVPGILLPLALFVTLWESVDVLP